MSQKSRYCGVFEGIMARSQRKNNRMGRAGRIVLAAFAALLAANAVGVM